MTGAPFSYVVKPFVGGVVGATPHGPARVSARPVGGSGSPSLSENKQLNEARRKARTIQPHHRKVEFLAKLAVQMMADKYGIETLGFMTLTFPEPVYCPKEAQRRLNSLLTNVIRPRYGDYICAIERHHDGKGGIHFHLLVSVGFNIKRNFDHDAVQRRDYRSASPGLRNEWAYWRETAPKYGFGRVELLPIRKGAEQIAKYISKYICKHITQRLPEDKGCRLVRISVGVRAGNSKFSWVENGAREWRRKLAAFAQRCGVRDLGEFAVKYGRKWAYRLRDAIMACADLIDVVEEQPQAL